MGLWAKHTIKVESADGGSSGLKNNQIITKYNSIDNENGSQQLDWISIRIFEPDISH